VFAPTAFATAEHNAWDAGLGDAEAESVRVDDPVGSEAFSCAACEDACSSQAANATTATDASRAAHSRLSTAATVETASADHRFVTGLPGPARRAIPVGWCENVPVRARVIVLAGPSGAGKSRLAARLGLPVLRLDDFYKNGDDPSLPRISEGANAGLVDWDHPDSWLPHDAIAAIDRLCAEGSAEVPIYEIARDGRHGSQVLDLGDSRFFVAEGIFAQEVVPPCRDRGVLAAAYCVRQHPMVTFWRRLTRDLREHRKPPLVLVRRGLALMRDQKAVVERAVALGCEPVSPEQAYTAVSALVSRSAADA
jgi:uridine kinase